MDEELLESCSPEVQDALVYIDEKTGTIEEYSQYSSPAFYALDRVNSPKVPEFIDEYENTVDPMVHVYENMDKLGFFVRLYNMYEDGDWDDDPALRLFRDATKSRQMSKGDFPLTDYSTTGPIWFLSQDESSSDTVNSAIDYFISNNPPDKEVNHPYRIGERALGVMALTEINSMKYKKEIQEISDWIARTSADVIHFENDEYLTDASYILISLLRTPGKEYSIVNKLIEMIKSAQKDNGSWEDDVATTGLGVLSLIHAGEGPKIPAIEAEQKLKIERNKRRRSKPKFVSTVPSTRSKTREIQIHDHAEQLIDQSNDVLRISTLRIDLLYEKIIDKLDNENDIQVRIVTSAGSSSGPRSKLKKAAMDELVKRTDGNVKEDELVHSRMIIADQKELLVSSADLTREQLYEEFNAGIHTEDKGTISSAIEFFDTVWDRAEHRGVK